MQTRSCHQQNMPESDGQLEAGAPEAAPFNMFGAVLAVNLMRQLGSIDTFNEQKARLEDKLYAKENVMLSVPTELLNPRDRADLEGKILFCIMAAALKIQPTQLVVDPAQAGGLLGTSDGCLVLSGGQLRPFEIKGTKCKKGKKDTVFVNGIRLKGTNWQDLFIVARKEDPDLWTDFSEYGRRGIWLAHVSRQNLLLAADANGKGHLPVVNATITPGSKRSWLGPYINWVRAKDVSREWWDAKVLRGARF